MPLSSGFGNNPLAVEASMESAECVQGYPIEVPISLGELTLDTGLIIPATGAGIVGRGAIMTNHNGLVWNATADQGDIVAFDWNTPANFRRLDSAAGYKPLKLLVLARKLDTTGSAAENADLELRASMSWLYSDPTKIQSQNPGDTALNSLTTPAGAVLGVKAIATAEEAFTWYALDLGARLLAEGKTLKENSSLRITLFPHEAVGAALAVEVIGLKLQYRTHVGFRDKTARII